MNDVLLAAGCSFTDKLYYSWDRSLSDDQRGGWDFWPELVGKELGLKTINLGKRGRGNTYILEEIIKGLIIHGSQVKVLMVLWSDIHRVFMPRWGYDIALDAVLRLGKSHQIVADEVWHFTQLMENYFNKHDARIIIDNHLANIKFLIDYCYTRDIKIIVGQGIGEIDTRLLLDSKFFQQVEDIKKHIIGWPFMADLDGYVISNMIPEKYHISDNDKHPNADGQKIIADKFLKQYYSVYES